MHADLLRYTRQISLTEIGMEGQQKLFESSVLLIGVGGLGCAAAQQICASGVGRLCMVDGDVVSLSNLHRQLLFCADDIGKNKAETAAAALSKQFPDTRITAVPEMLHPSLALKLFVDFDIVIDATDRLDVRYLIDDVCHLYNKVWVYGSVNKFSAQWAVFRLPEFNVGYRNLLPKSPKSSEIVNCNSDGILSMVPTVVGSIQALEAVKVLTNIQVCTDVQSIDFKDYRTYSFALPLFDVYPGPKTEKEVLEYDYAGFCQTETAKNEVEITYQELNAIIQSGNVLILDVRDEDELPVCKLPRVKNIPLGLLGKFNIDTHGADTVVCICQTGNRSLKAVDILSNILKDIKLLSLKGGMENIDSE